jgi:hypothetical protein
MSFVPNPCGVPTISVPTLVLPSIRLCCSEDGEDVESLGEELF